MSVNNAKYVTLSFSILLYSHIQYISNSSNISLNFHSFQVRRDVFRRSLLPFGLGGSVGDTISGVDGNDEAEDPDEPTNLAQTDERRRTGVEGIGRRSTDP
jgi:hypothetical protein